MMEEMVVVEEIMMEEIVEEGMEVAIDKITIITLLLIRICKY